MIDKEKEREEERGNDAERERQEESESDGKARDVRQRECFRERDGKYNMHLGSSPSTSQLRAFKGRY